MPSDGQKLDSFPESGDLGGWCRGVLLKGGDLCAMGAGDTEGIRWVFQGMLWAFSSGQRLEGCEGWCVMNKRLADITHWVWHEADG